MYRIFIIGAGFSKPAGLPLGNELWKLVLNESYLEKNFYDLLESDIYSYLEYQKKVHGKKLILKILRFGSSLKIGQSLSITFHTPQDFCCQEQNEFSSYYKNPQYNQSTLFLSQSN